MVVFYVAKLLWPNTLQHREYRRKVHNLIHVFGWQQKEQEGEHRRFRGLATAHWHHNAFTSVHNRKSFVPILPILNVRTIQTKKSSWKFVSIKLNAFILYYKDLGSPSPWCGQTMHENEKEKKFFSVCTPYIGAGGNIKPVVLFFCPIWHVHTS